MSRFVFFFSFISLLVLPVLPKMDTARAADVINHVPLAETFAQQMADEVVDILVTSESRAEREKRFAALLRQNADLRRIGLFTLGRFARTISKEDFATYQSLLETFIVKVYANRLGAYSDQKITILGSQQKKRNVIVKSRIEFTTSREPVTLDWWLIEDAPGVYKLFDVRILGIWMAQEQRATFLSVLKNNNSDIKALLNHIRQQVEIAVAEKE